MNEMVVGMAPQEAAPHGEGALAFVVGTLGFGFESESRRGYFTEKLGADSSASDRAKMAARLLDKETSIDEAGDLVWMVMRNDTAYYAIQPEGPFAAAVYRRLVESLSRQEKKEIDRVVIPGRVRGSKRLSDGTTVPVVVPSLRGMTDLGVEGVMTMLAATPERQTPEAPRDRRKRVVSLCNGQYDMMNSHGNGMNSRALDYALVSFLQNRSMVEPLIAKDLMITKCENGRSPISPPGADSWDVQITAAPSTADWLGHLTVSLTIDIGDVVPVIVGSPRVRGG